MNKYIYLLLTIITISLTVDNISTTLSNYSSIELPDTISLFDQWPTRDTLTAISLNRNLDLISENLNRMLDDGIRKLDEGGWK